MHFVDDRDDVHAHRVSTETMQNVQENTQIHTAHSITAMSDIGSSAVRLLILHATLLSVSIRQGKIG